MNTAKANVVVNDGQRAHDHLLLCGGRIARIGKQVVSYAPMAGIIAVAMGVGAELPGGHGFSIVGAAQAQSICDPSFTRGCRVIESGTFLFGPGGEAPGSDIRINASDINVTFSGEGYEGQLDGNFTELGNTSFQQTENIVALFGPTYASLDMQFSMDKVRNVDVIVDTANWGVRNGEGFSSDQGYSDFTFQSSAVSFGSPIPDEVPVLTGRINFTARAYAAFENFEVFVESAGSDFTVSNSGTLESYNGLSAFGYFTSNIIRNVWSGGAQSSNPDWTGGRVDKLEGGRYTLLNSGIIRSESDSPLNCYNLGSCRVENSGSMYIDETLNTPSRGPNNNFDFTAMEVFAPILREIPQEPIFSLNNSGVIRGGSGGVYIYAETAGLFPNVQERALLVSGQIGASDLLGAIQIENSGVIAEARSMPGLDTNDREEAVIWSQLGGTIVNSGTIGELAGVFEFSSSVFRTDYVGEMTAIASSNTRRRLKNLLSGPGDPFDYEEVYFDLSVKNEASGRILSNAGFGIYSQGRLTLDNAGLIQQAGEIGQSRVPVNAPGFFDIDLSAVQSGEPETFYSTNDANGFAVNVSSSSFAGADITNSGQIIGAARAITVYGDLDLTNSGLISARTTNGTEVTAIKATGSLVSAGGLSGSIEAIGGNNILEASGTGIQAKNVTFGNSTSQGGFTGNITVEGSFAGGGGQSGARGIFVSTEPGQAVSFLIVNGDFAGNITVTNRAFDATSYFSSRGVEVLDSLGDPSDVMVTGGYTGSITVTSGLNAFAESQRTDASAMVVNDLVIGGDFSGTMLAESSNSAETLATSDLTIGGNFTSSAVIASVVRDNSLSTGDPADRGYSGALTAAFVTIGGDFNGLVTATSTGGNDTSIYTWTSSHVNIGGDFT